MRKLKTLLLNVRDNVLTEFEVDDDLHEFYKALGVNMIELPERSIGGKYFTIMCDEEGLLKADPIISCYSEDDMSACIVGNIMLFNMSDEGDLLSLTDDDIEHIKKNVRTVSDMSHPDYSHKVIMVDL